MSKPYLVIITGFPGTGKTSLGRVLSDYLKAPFITKDAFKEIVFDTLGSSDQAWSRQVSGTAHRIMDYIIDEELRAGHGVILESNFKADVDSTRFEAIQKKYNCPCIQILCWAEGGILAERFLARQRSDERHQGQVIDISDEQIRKDFAAGKCEILKIDAPLLEVDTTDFAAVNYEVICKKIASLIKL